MNYSKLTDAQLSEKLFYAANSDTDRVIFHHGACGGIQTQTYEKDDIDFFSIFDFEDLMPIAIENHVFYEFKLGNDYNRDEYKAVAVFEHGHDHVTFDNDVCRAIAICLLKRFESNKERSK